MTTKPESPDSALLACPFCKTTDYLETSNAWGRQVWLHPATGSCVLRCFVIDDVAAWNTRASAGDQAVGYVNAHHLHCIGLQIKAEGKALTCEQIQLSYEQTEYYDTPLYTRAQDAAGKGVEPACPDCGGTGVISMDELGDGPCPSCGWVEVAKPAQVGQKYRPFTEDDVRTALAAANAVSEAVITRGTVRDALAFLARIGAVVPAQEGGG